MAVLGGAAGLPAQESGSVERGTEITGTILLKWTAPGDDHYVGRATRYVMRYQASSLGPLNTEAEWSAARQVSNMPSPSWAGSVDSVLIQGLTAGASYYFGLRTIDEEANISLISNSPLVTAIGEECCEGRVGNVDGLGNPSVPTLGDLSALVDFLFISLEPPGCWDEANVDGEAPSGPDGTTLSDLSALIDNLFISLQPTPPCP